MKWVLHQSNISWFKKMFLRTLALVFMFLVRLSIPRRLSLLQVIRNWYGDTIATFVRKFEKVDFKHRKGALDLNFLKTCRTFNVITKILQFRVANKNIRRSLTYQKCLNHLLLVEINNKKKNLKVLVNELSSVKSNLLRILNFLDFNHVMLLLSTTKNLSLSVNTPIKRN